ncbi:hypothetical protein KKA14_09770 [bacterium]|nr:hypothetical protein [bacterium]
MYKKRTFIGLFYLAVLSGLVTCLSGCASNVRYSPGIYTHHVEGQVLLESEQTADSPFIVVKKHHRIFFETSSGYLYRVSVSICHPDEKGKYSIEFGADTAQVDLIFYANGFLTDSFRFHRTLGIGKYVYDITIKKDKSWKNSFFLLIKPTLIEYVKEKRYRLPELDEHFIGDWIGKIEESL